MWIPLDWLCRIQGFSDGISEFVFNESFSDNSMGFFCVGSFWEQEIMQPKIKMVSGNCLIKWNVGIIWKGFVENNKSIEREFVFVGGRCILVPCLQSAAKRIPAEVEGVIYDISTVFDLAGSVFGLVSCGRGGVVIVEVAVKGSTCAWVVFQFEGINCPQIDKFPRRSDNAKFTWEGIKWMVLYVERTSTIGGSPNLLLRRSNECFH